MMDKKNKTYSDKVILKIKRHKKAKTEKKYSVLSSFSVFGLVGWNIVVPVLAGIFIGYWLDEYYQYKNVSWTLTGLLFGAVVGCINVCYWLNKERK